MMYRLYGGAKTVTYSTGASVSRSSAWEISSVSGTPFVCKSFTVLGANETMSC